MRYLKPCYYEDFVCIADKCPATCCAGWQIVIDQESLEKYSEEKGAFGNRLKNSVDWAEGVFYQYDRKCAFLNEENLCDLYAQLGSDALCETCRRYPRHVEEYEDSRELSLSLSCPEAARMIVDFEEKVTFLEEESSEVDDFEEFDFLLYTQLEDARHVAFQILQNRETDFRLRLMQVMGLAEEFQQCLDEDRFWEVESIVRKYKTQELSGSHEKAGIRLEKERYVRMRQSLEAFRRMEHLQPQWETFPERAEEKLYASGEQTYLKICRDFDLAWGYESENRRKWEIIGEQLMIFFVYTYFCGAVYDDGVYSKMALAVFSVLWIQELMMLCWLENGREADIGDMIRCAYSYAREVEHSDLNLDVLESWLEEEREERQNR